MPIALLTTYLAPYRMPLFERLAERHEVEVLCFGRGERYVPPWFADLGAQLEAAPFPARRLSDAREAVSIGKRYDTIIAPFAGGAILPAAYLGARRFRRPFVLWASVWVQPRALVHRVTLPAVRHIYRHADAVLTYGEHVSRFVTAIRGNGRGVFTAPQSVEPELFGRRVGDAEVAAFRARHGLVDEPLVLYVGRLVPEKGVAVLLDAWRRLRARAVLVLVGEGPLGTQAERTEGVRLLGALPRAGLPAAYAAAELAVLPSVPTERFQEPWGMVCNEAMHQRRPVVATDAVGAAAGGLVRDAQTGLVVPAGDADALGRAIERLLTDAPFRLRLGEQAGEAVSAYTYDAMVKAFDQALRRAGAAH